MITWAELTRRQKLVLLLIAAHSEDPVPTIDFSPGTENHDAANDLEAFGFVYRARFGYILTLKGREATIDR